MKLRELEARTGQALHGCRGESTVVLILPLLGWGILLLFELLGRHFCLVQGMPGLVPWITGLRCLAGALGSVPFCSGAAWWFMQAAAGEGNSLSDYCTLLRSPALHIRAARLYGLLWLAAGALLLPAGVCGAGIRLLLHMALEQADCFWYLFGSIQLLALLALWLWLVCYLLSGMIPAVLLFAVYPFRSPFALCRLSFVRMQGKRRLLLLHLLRWLPLLLIPGGAAAMCMGLAVLLEEKDGTAETCDTNSGTRAAV